MTINGGGQKVIVKPSLLGTILALAVWALGATPSDARTYGDSGLPYHFRWGSCRVEAKAIPTDDSENKRVVAIRDVQGRKVREYRGAGIQEIREIILTGHSAPCLIIQVTEHAGDSVPLDVYILDQDAGVDNLLSMGAINVGIDKVRSGPQGHPMILGTMALNHFPTLNNQGPNCAFAYSWNGKRYVSITEKFPATARRLAAKYRREVSGRKSKGHLYDEELRDLKISALGYFANACASGDGDRAMAWLRTNSPEMAKWLRSERHNVDEWTHGMFVAETDRELERMEKRPETQP